MALLCWALNLSPCLCAEWKNRPDWPQSLLHGYFDNEHHHHCQFSSISSSLSLRLSLKLYISTPCYCVVLRFWISSRYIVTLPEVCHCGSSVSVGKWTCCSVADYSFPCLGLSLSNLQPASIILLPPCGSVWQPENTISLIIGIIWSSFAFDCKTINAQMYWWLTCGLSHQLTSKTGLITSPLRLFGPQGSGSGFGSVCAVFLSDLHDPLPLNEGEQGWEMRHFRAQGFIPTAHWITLQNTKGRRESFFKEIFCSERCSRPS